MQCLSFVARYKFTLVRRVRKRRDAFHALLERVFKIGHLCCPISHFRCEGYTTASCTNDKSLLPLGMKDRLCQGFDF